MSAGHEQDPPKGVLGIDEAGRGSLIGPLVVGGFLADRKLLPRLRGLGVRDSKELSPARRLETHRRLAGVGRSARVLAYPARIDAYVEKGKLNRLEAEMFARLILLLNPEEAIVDACDPVEARFEEEVRRISGSSIPIRARHHADRDVPVVGAASIVAKVARDRAIVGLGRRLGEDIGSGYPSDARTVAAVRDRLAREMRPPPWLRASWSTTERLMKEVRTRPLESFGP